MMEQSGMDQRSEPRVVLTKYHCVEVQTIKTLVTYQFKIWNISSKGMCLLVGSRSKFLSSVEIGEIVEVKYYPLDLSWPPDVKRTEIRHITKADPERFKDHCFVGLMILPESAIKQ